MKSLGPSKHRVWKTLSLRGGLNDASSLLAALTASGFGLVNEAEIRAAFRSRPFRQSLASRRSEKSIDLVKLSLQQLRLEITSYANVLSAGIAQGLALCPPEVGPELRIQYANQREGESLEIAMLPLPGFGSGGLVFCVERTFEGMWLSGANAAAQRANWTGAYFVFSRPRI
jgi:hypothetical protein